MKRKFTYGVLLTLLTAFSGCTKSDIEIPGNQISAPMSITNLRKVQLLENLEFGTTAIKGIVVSNAEGKNIANNLIAVQEEGKEAAILLEVNGASNLTFGAEVEIDLKGTTLTLQNKELRVSDITAAAIKPTGKVVTVIPKVTNLSTVLNEAQYWGPILVRIEKISLSGGQNGNMSGELVLSDGITTLHSTFLPSSVFANNQYPDKAEVYIGIIRQSDDKIFINPGKLDDIQAEANEVIEDFEDASNTNYDVKTLTFKTGDWIIDGGITATSSADLKTGKQSVRLQGTTTNANRKGILSMNFNLKGVKKLRLSHGIYPASAETGNVNPTTFDVEISRNNGLTYTLLKQVEVNIKSTELITTSIEVNAKKTEDVRFRT